MAKPKKNKKPLSPAQIKQRQDASLKARKHATGPKTDKGKKASSMNAWKHGMSAKASMSAMQGKPCQTTCPKYDTCPFIKEQKTKAGGRCLDVIDWSVIEEAGDAIVSAQQGDMEALQGLAALLMGQDVALMQQAFKDIQDKGMWVSQDVFGADGDIVGSKEFENPLINVLIKLKDKMGINLPEFLATPQSKAKAITDEETQLTAAEMTRQMSRMIPQNMQVPSFDDAEVVDADVVSE